MIRRKKSDIEADNQVLDLRAELRGLRTELQQMNSHRYFRIHNSIPRMMWYNLLRGLAVGLGTVLGASVLLSVFIWSLSQIEFLPIIGEWATQIMREVEGSAR